MATPLCYILLQDGNVFVLHCALQDGNVFVLHVAFQDGNAFVLHLALEMFMWCIGPCSLALALGYMLIYIQNYASSDII